MDSKILFSFLFAISLTFIMACNSKPEVKSIPTANSESEIIEEKEILAENKVDVEMEIEGMVCAMGCAKFIEEKVSDIDGIAFSQVDFEEGIGYFEFDKTVLSKEDIATFINEIHDGQYKAVIVDEENPDVKENSTTIEAEESITSVVEQFNFSFPELLTYFMKRL